MSQRNSFPCRRNLRAYAAAFISYLMLAGQVAPLALGAAPRPLPPPAAAPASAARAAAPQPAAPLVFAAPIITATKVDAWDDTATPDGKAEPGQTITYTVTISNTGDADATGVQFTDNVDTNTSLVGGSVMTQPITANDAYNVIGNVGISPNAAQGLLANDTDPDQGNNSQLTVSAIGTDNSAPFSFTTANGGTVTSSTTDGAFNYTPAPGFSGSDSFTYTTTDNTGKTDTATVTLTISATAIWFIDDSATVGGNGTLASPFNCYTGTSNGAQTCFSDTASDDTGDIIFLYTGTYSGGYALLNNQRLLGQGISVSLASAAGVTTEVYTTPLPTNNSDPSTVTIQTTVAATNAVNLGVGNSNTLRGFTLGNTTGADIASTASGFGTLTASEVILNGNGQALNLDSGALAATFVSISSNTSGGQGIALDQVTGTLTATGGTTITDPTTQCILVTGSTANINFGNTNCTQATDGISLQNNSAGTRTFGTISVTGASGVGFLHSGGGGTVNVTGATTITNPGGNGIDVDGSNANLSFAGTTVDKGSTSNIGVDLTNNATRTISFTTLAVTTTNAFALNTNSSGTVNVTTAAGSSLTQSGAGGGAASLTNTTLGLNFTSISSNLGGNGIIISGGTGSFSSTTTNLQNNAGIGLFMMGTGVAANFGTTTVNSSAGDAVDLDSNTAAITFGDLDLTPDPGLRGLDAQNNTGTITSTSGTILTSDAAAINVSGTSAASLSPLALVFDSITVSAPNNVAVNGVALAFASGTVSINGGTITGNTAAAFLVSGGTVSVTDSGGITQAKAAPLVSVAGGHDNTGVAGTGTLTFQTSTLSATNGTGLQFDNADGFYNFNGTTTLNGGDAGIDILNGSAGTFSFPATTITSPSGTAFNVNTGNPAVTYSGTITDNTAGQRAVNIDGTTGGAISINSVTTASVVGGVGNTGININNANGNVTFTTLTLGTSSFRHTAQPVTITGGTGTYGLGAVNVFTNNVTGIGATNADGTLNSSSGEVNTNQGTTVTIDGPAGLTTLGISLTKLVSSGGSATGLNLQDTNGSFTVTGSGGTCNSAASCTGGSLTSKASGNPGTDGIRLQSVTNVSLTRMYIFDNGGNGVFGHLVNGIKIDNCWIDSNADNTTGGFDPVGGFGNEANVHLMNVSGGAVGAANETSITNSTITNAFEHDVEIDQTTASLTDFLIDNSSITNNGASTQAGSRVLIILNAPGTTSNLRVEDSTITGNRTAGALTSHGIQGTTSAGTLNAKVFRNSILNNAAGIDLSTATSGVLNFDVTDNGGSGGVANNGASNGKISGSQLIGLSIFTNNNATGSVNGFIRGNTIGTQGVPASGSAEGRGLQIQNEGAVNLTVLINNNIVQSVAGNQALNVQHGIAVAGVAGTTNATVTNNTLRDNDTDQGLPSTGSRPLNTDILNTGTLCTDISGNTLSNNTGQGGGTSVLRVAETAGTHNNHQNGAAGLAASNTLGTTPAGPGTVTVQGSPNFNTPTCTQPSAFAPETFDDSADTIGGSGGVGVQADSATSAPAAAAAPQDNNVTSRPFVSLPRATSAPKATAAPAKAAPAAPKRAGGTTFRHTAADSSAPLNPEPVAAPASKPKPAESKPEPVAQRRKVSAPVLVSDPGGPNGSGGLVSVNIGTLRPGDSVTITFQVVIDNPYTGGPNVSNQGTVSGSNFSNVLTDDPAAGGAADPTLTPINSANLSINDAKVAEPASPNTIDMVFTVSLSSPATGAVTVNFATSDQSPGPGHATAGTCGNPGADYVSTNGQVNFSTGQQVKTINVPICSDAASEPDETFLVTLSTPVGGTIVDGTATGTITTNTPGTFLISELRTSGPLGPNDDFVELYNNSSSPLTVTASDASAGYGLFKMGAACTDTPVLIGTIPNGTIIPARGHYLMVGSAYGLANYGGTGAAAGNLTFSSGLGNDQNVAVFSTSNIANISSLNRLDAVGFGTNTGGVCDLLREPSTLPPVSGSMTEHTFFRKQCDFVGGVGCTVSGNPKDTNDNNADFMFADTQGTFISGVPQRLGAPGPENLASPIRRDTSGIGLPLLDGSVGTAAHPNRTRDFTPDAPNNSSFGTLTIRRRVVNNTGGNVTRLRFRIIELTTFPSPGGGVADLRARTGVIEASVGPVGDATTCTASGAGSPPCNVSVQPTTLETPPAQPNGGGMNSTLSAGTITTGTPLANGASLNVNFLLGIQQTGTFRFLIIIEALP